MDGFEQTTAIKMLFWFFETSFVELVKLNPAWLGCNTTTELVGREICAPPVALDNTRLNIKLLVSLLFNKGTSMVSSVCPLPKDNVPLVA